MDNNFIDNLKRDKARGTVAPHQILLLITLKFLHEKKGNFDFTIEEIINEFDNVWEKYSDSFKSNSKLVGMPIKAFFNQRLIEIEFNSEIEDFRNNGNLKQKIKAIVLDSSLIDFLKCVSYSELEKRIVI